jgi:hypothetical protein
MDGVEPKGCQGQRFSRLLKFTVQGLKIKIYCNLVSLIVV